MKVLYNYYAATGADDVPAGDAPDDEPPGTTYRGGLVKGLMMQQQLERESSLRPVDPHPNIVPLISYFVDRAPGDEAVAETAPTAISDMRTEPATSDCGESAMEPSQQWQGADVFTEGFGGRPHTYFLLMPR